LRPRAVGNSSTQSRRLSLSGHSARTWLGLQSGRIGNCRRAVGPFAGGSDLTWNSVASGPDELGHRFTLAGVRQTWARDEQQRGGLQQYDQTRLSRRPKRLEALQGAQRRRVCVFSHQLSPAKTLARAVAKHSNIQGHSKSQISAVSTAEGRPPGKADAAKPAKGGPLPGFAGNIWLMEGPRRLPHRRDHQGRAGGRENAPDEKIMRVQVLSNCFCTGRGWRGRERFRRKGACRSLVTELAAAYAYTCQRAFRIGLRQGWPCGGLV